MDWIAIVLIVLSATLAACSCDDDETSTLPDRNDAEPECEGGDCQPDSGTPQVIDSAVDTGHSIPDSAAPDAPDAKKLVVCLSNADCDDGVFCNGVERCVRNNDDDTGVEGTCYFPPSGPCIDDSQCVEEYQSCDCDFDRDGLKSRACGGPDCDDDNDGCDDGIHCHNSVCNDCDDHDDGRNEMISEVCDDSGKDEDCNPETFRNQGTLDENGKTVNAEGDLDGDGYIDAKCFNIHSETGKRYGGYDCNDEDADVYPGAKEICDGIDNDCDGLTDEDDDGHELALQTVFCRDYDGDRWGNKKELKRSCNTPEGYVEYDPDGEFDCDDHDKDKRPQNDEICDGKDNDCDGETDEPDREGGLLFDQPSFTNTVVLCDSDSGEYYIPDGGCPPEKLHCSDNVNLGCETFATTLSSCRACETNCLFSCGEQGCDEIDKLSVGRFHVCAVTTEGQAACWGRNSDGQLGNDSTRISLIPVGVVGIANVKEISAGKSHSCAIVGSEREVYCWGSNEFGKLGVGTIVSSPVPGIARGPSILPSISGATSIATGGDHTCAVFDGGKVACWGSQEDGRLGNGMFEADDVWHPDYVVDFDLVQIENGVSVVAGDSHSCLLTDDGKVLCWGEAIFGQLGVEEVEAKDPSVAVEVPGLSDLLQMGESVVSLSAGYRHTCVLSSSGKVYCWGNNLQLQLGRTNEEDAIIPKEVTGLSDIVAIAAGNYHTCAISPTNGLMCWGSNEYGERGDDTPGNEAVPQTVSIDTVDKIATGGRVSCARTPYGQGLCWGESFYGQLGDNQRPVDFQPVPQAIHSLYGSIP